MLNLYCCIRHYYPLRIVQTAPFTSVILYTLWTGNGLVILKGTHLPWFIVIGCKLALTSRVWCIFRCFMGLSEVLTAVLDCQ